MSPENDTQHLDNTRKMQGFSYIDIPTVVQLFLEVDADTNRNKVFFPDTAIFITERPGFPKKYLGLLKRHDQNRALDQIHVLSLYIFKNPRGSHMYQKKKVQI